MNNSIRFVFYIGIGLSICANIVIFFLGIVNFAMLPYYNDLNNYETLSISVIEITYNEDNIYIFCDTNSGEYRISGLNYLAVIDNNITGKISNGDQINIVSAPGYFGDGYDYPIVGIEKNGITYLDSETGIQNLLEDLSKGKKDFIILMTKSLGILVICIIGSVYYSKKNRLAKQEN